MSYRDLRNFSEAMRSLGFPHPISLESFRTPNWELVEAAARWLAARLEPDADGALPPSDQRVAFVAHLLALFHSRGNVRLSGRRVYGADGWAVRELLKVATVLREALRPPTPQHNQPDEKPLTYDLGSRLSEIKQTRVLATDITAQGALLYDLLAKEPENKELREQALSRPLDMGALEACIVRAVSAAAARLAARRDQIDGVAAGEAALDGKIERRRADLVRAEKRLHAVQKIKPVYQAELTVVEEEIEQLWEQYVVRYRCVAALQHQLCVLEGVHQEAAEEQQAAIMQLIHKYEAEDVLGKITDSDELESSDEGKDPSEGGPARPSTRPATRLRIKTAGASGLEARRAFGSMGARSSLGTQDDSPSDSDLSDTLLYAGGRDAGGAGATGGRWSRAHLTDHDDLVDLAPRGEGGEGDSLDSSSESELRVGSARPGGPQPGRASVLSDNEF